MSGERLHHEVLIAGFGGQGVVLAGQLLANAALAEGREVVWAPSYGPEMRGGPVHCTIIVASQRIGSPEVSLDRLAHRVKPDGLFILNSSLVRAKPENDTCEILPIPANDAAQELGNPRVANVIMLGAFLEKRPIVSPGSLERAMRLLAGKGYEHLIAINQQALARGADLAREAGADGS